MVGNSGRFRNRRFANEARASVSFGLGAPDSRTPEGATRRRKHLIRRKIMRLSAPTYSIWLLAAILGILGIVGKFIAIQYVSTYSFWLVAGGFVLLFLATLFKKI